MSHSLSRRRAGLRAALSLFAFSLIGAKTFGLDPVPVSNTKPVEYPDWWFQQSVVPRLNPSNPAPVWPGSYRAVENFAALNQGQLKVLAVAAYDYFEAGLAGGAGNGIKDLVSAWFQLNPGDPIPAPGARQPRTANVNDYSAINLGQLKTVAQPFYDRLIAAGQIPILPWLVAGHAPADDYAAANLGQAKSLFSFVINGADTDGDGLPDWFERVIGTDPNNADSDSDGFPDGFEVKNGLNAGDSANGLADSDGDGLSDGEEFRLGTNPHAKDTDGDHIDDNLDGWPNNPDLKPLRLPETRYAVVRLDQMNDPVPPDADLLQLGDGGQILYTLYQSGANGQPVRSYWWWSNGTKLSVPLTDGKADLISLHAPYDNVRLSPDGKRVAGAMPYPNPDVIGDPTMAATWTAPTALAGSGTANPDAVPLAAPLAAFGVGASDHPFLLTYWASCINNTGKAAGRGRYEGFHGAHSWTLDGGLFWTPDTATQLGAMWGPVSPVPIQHLATDIYFDAFRINNVETVIGYRLETQSSGLSEMWVSEHGGAPSLIEPISAGSFYSTPALNSPVDGNGKSQWIVADGLWVKAGGGWQSEPFGDQLPAALPKKITGYGTGVNDRCEIIGNFTTANGKPADLIRNGQPIWTNDLVSGYTVTNLVAINNYGVILAGAQVGKGASATDPSYPVLLVPVDFKEVAPASGFDGETEPHWLMVPQNGANYAKAHTPASSSLKMAFSIKPGGSHETVSPASTTTSPETITVNGVDIGDTSKVAVGVGTAVGVGAELNISVRKFQQKTVAIHAVTQRYTTPMPLSANANPQEGKPSQVCVKPKTNATIIGATPPGGDDHQDTNSGVIDTGVNGICETVANSQYDQQIIPKGQGIHIDIAPSSTPTAAALEIYLDQVFGLQTNTYFTVTRSDFAIDYDINIRNKVLDISPLSLINSPEQDAIVNGGASATDFNVYYVFDFQTKAIQGHPVSHSAVGASSAAKKATYIRDAAKDVLQCTAHEIGHLFGVSGHSDEEKLQNGNPNPTYLEGKDPRKRLMYSTEQLPGPRLLIKSEWDIVNANLP